MHSHTMGATDTTELQDVTRAESQALCSETARCMHKMKVFIKAQLLFGIQNLEPRN